MSTSKTIFLDNGDTLTISIGDILRHISWDTQSENDKFLNRQLYRVTGFSVLPKDNSEVVMLKQMWHPMREYMYKISQLESKADPAKYPNAQQAYIFTRHDVQFGSAEEIQILEDVPKNMIDSIQFQEDPTRSPKFKSYYNK